MPILRSLITSLPINDILFWASDSMKHPGLLFKKQSWISKELSKTFFFVMASFSHAQILLTKISEQVELAFARKFLPDSV